MTRNRVNFHIPGVVRLARVTGYSSVSSCNPDGRPRWLKEKKIRLPMQEA